jgi:hypothetical protein
MSLTGQITSVLEKSQRLIELCDALTQENALLKRENQTLIKSVESGKLKTTEIEEKFKASKLAMSLEGISVKEISSDEKTLDIKQKISDFVREIDKCIVLLKK